ncbi:phage portal protein [Corynebacterium hindlerae]|uniref:Phage portal protein n=1 Tax=Corynebacterium hindlerae TaxID=699041 RepID=A0A7G5FDP6_9CORY|nr:phage portal protein [Corynebacterium hindlerae]QMV84737.1 phage portal protein [Corynebacterium hindlerae]
MSFLARVRDALAIPAVAAGTVAYESPWATRGNLIEVFAPEIAPINVSRAVAMSIPAVARARRIICTAVARCSLTVTPATTQPAWVDRTDGPVSPWHRMVWTVDDLLFYGASLWAVERDTDGRVIAADRVPFDEWGVTATGAITWRGVEVDDQTVIHIPAADEGILTTGAAAIRHAAALAAAASKAANSPAAHTELHQTEGEPLTDSDVQKLVDGWIRARNSPNGAVSFTNKAIQVIEHGTFDTHLLIDGRNAAALDIARMCGIPAVLLDVAAVDNTIKYENIQARNLELIDYCLDSFMAPIAARLGMDDVVAPGQSVAFDVEQLTAIPDMIRVPDDRTSDDDN